MNVQPKLFAACLLCISTLAVANEADINQAMANAKAQYQANELLPAAAQLDYAAALIRQEKAEQVKNYFPPAPAGWKAEPSDVTTASIFGSMFSVTHRYYNNTQSVYVNITLESPMALQSFHMMLSNPSVLTLAGGRLIKVQGMQAIQKIDNNQFELKFRTKNGAVITLEGSPEVQNTILALANTLDTSQL